MTCIDLPEFIELVGSEEAARISLAAFSVPRDPDVESFIHDKCIPYEKAKNARSFVLIDEESDVVGFFSLALNSITLPQDLSPSKKNCLVVMEGTLTSLCHVFFSDRLQG